MKCSNTLENMIAKRSACTPSVIAEGIPFEIADCYHYSVALGYYQTPDYD